MLAKLSRRLLIGTIVLVMLYYFSATHPVNGHQRSVNDLENYTAKQQVYSGMGALARLWSQTTNVGNVNNLVATSKVC